jgi:hypothetical protein
VFDLGEAAETGRLVQSVLCVDRQAVQLTDHRDGAKSSLTVFIFSGEDQHEEQGP